ncbi:hypothetical protein MY11210_007778 [Beauveria gryllotalpidicola]
MQRKPTHLSVTVSHTRSLPISISRLISPVIGVGLDTGHGDQCCGNDSYCFVSTGGESRCCPLGSNCVADSPCNSKSYYCTRTATAALSLASVAANATETGCCGRRCPQPQYFLCPPELGGNCCPYGAECRADGSCVAPMTSTTTTTTTATTAFTTSSTLPTAQCPSGACATSAVGGGGLSPTTKAGIAATVVAGTGVVAGALAWLWLLRKKRAKARAAARAIGVSEVPGDAVGEPRGYFGGGGGAEAAPGAARAVPSQPNTPVEIDSAVPEDDAVEMGDAPRVENVDMYELEATEVGRDTSSDEATSEKEVAV